MREGLNFNKLAVGSARSLMYINLQIYLYIIMHMYSIRQFSDLFGRRLLIAGYASSAVHSQRQQLCGGRASAVSSEFV